MNHWQSAACSGMSESVENMTDYELRRVQKLQLGILKEVKRVCEKNNIRYFLDAGTLLGAIRHDGFIPWDDDLDIAMERSEYERFIRVAQKELGEAYFLQTQDTDVHYGLPFAKVRLCGTQFLENKSKKSKARDEIFIDIFPYDTMPEGRFQQKKVAFQLKVLSHLNLIKHGYEVWSGEGTANMIKFLPFRLLALIFSKSYIKNKIKQMIITENKQKSHRVWIQDGQNYMRWNYPADLLQHFTEHVFENESFPVPAEYDTWLKITYGDYMQLPPEDQRGDYHQIITINFGKYADKDRV